MSINNQIVDIHKNYWSSTRHNFGKMFGNFPEGKITEGQNLYTLSQIHK